jgi:hypothetical protein
MFVEINKYLSFLSHWTLSLLKYMNGTNLTLYMAEKDRALVVFQDRKIRKTWFNDEWWFVAVDIIEALTDSSGPKGYIKDMKRRDEGFAEGGGKLPPPLL